MKWLGRWAKSEEYWWDLGDSLADPNSRCDDIAASQCMWKSWGKSSSKGDPVCGSAWKRVKGQRDSMKYLQLFWSIIPRHTPTSYTYCPSIIWKSHLLLMKNLSSTHQKCCCSSIVPWASQSQHGVVLVLVFPLAYKLLCSSAFSIFREILTDLLKTHALVKNILHLSPFIFHFPSPVSISSKHPSPQNS